MELEQSIQTMLQELRQAAEFGGQVQHKLTDANHQLSSWRQDVESTVNDLISEITQLETELLAQKDAVSQHVQAFLGDAVNPLIQAISAGQETLRSGHDQTVAMIQSVSEASGQFRELISDKKSDLESGIQELTSAARDVRSQITSGFNEAHQGVLQLTGFVNEAHQEWQGIVQQTTQELQNAQQECQAQLESEFCVPMEEGFNQFNDLLLQINQDTLVHPMKALKDQATQMVDQQIGQVFNQGFQELNQLMDEMMDKISGASEQSSAERQALHEIFKTLEQFMQPIMDQVNSVKSLGSSVGIHF
jgi:uncharacterized phage infection (PIP) family protein YhgE